METSALYSRRRALRLLVCGSCCAVPNVAVLGKLREPLRHESAGCLTAVSEDQSGSCDAIPNVQFIPFNWLNVGAEKLSLVERTIGSMVRQSRRSLGVDPEVRIYNDIGRPNALATRMVLRRNTDGTVLLGKGMIETLVSDATKSDLVLIGVLAHELGHIFQFRGDFCTGLLCDGKVLKAELHADFMAGFVLRRMGAQITLRNVGDLVTGWAELGDELDFTDCSHHGTGEQRLQCLEAGFRKADMQNTTSISVASDGRRFVEDLVSCGTGACSS